LFRFWLEIVGASEAGIEMKILLTADPEVPVPPILYGGIERVINQLGQGYQALGHETILLANPQSESPHFNSKYAWTGMSSVSRLDSLRNALKMREVIRKEKPDLIHSFSRIAYLTGALGNHIPIIQTYQREISNTSTTWAKRIFGSRMHLSACGAHMTKNLSTREAWTTVPNCCNTDELTPLSNLERTHLVFLGRIEPIKGILEAIEFAQKTKKPLIIAGNIEPEWQAFFNTEVKPLIDGEHIAYIGPVNDQQKQELLSKAIAFLMLIKWEEPFGIVMAEALSCGVPVVALDRGSVPEVVMHGQNGIRGRTLPDLIHNFSLIETIASADCRKDAIQRFSIEAVSRAYLDIIV